MRRSWIIVFVILTISGCSTQLGYRFADTFVEWEINKYVDLNAQQQADVDRAITELHYWHATSELPVYTKQLQELRDKIAAENLSLVDLQTTYKQLFSAWQRILNELEPYALQFLPELTDEQTEQLLKKLAERQQDERQELREANGELAEQRQRWRKRSEKNARTWLRRLTPVQERLLIEWVNQREATASLWLDYNDQWQQNFAEALNQRDNAAIFSGQMRALMYDSERLKSPELKQITEQNRAATLDFFYLLYQSLTDEQRQRVVRKLDGYIEDMEALAQHFAAEPRP